MFTKVEVSLLNLNNKWLSVKNYAKVAYVKKQKNTLGRLLYYHGHEQVLAIELSEVQCGLLS